MHGVLALYTCFAPSLEEVARSRTATLRPPRPVRHIVSNSACRTATRTALLATALWSVACRSGDQSNASAGSGGKSPGGTVVISVSADAEPLIPPYANQQQTRLIVEQLFDRLPGLGGSGTTRTDRGLVPP